MDFARKLRTYMSRARISQEVMGENVGVSQNQVSRWLRGVNTPDVRQGLLIARMLGLSIDHLMDEGRPPYSQRELELDREIRRIISALGVEEAWRRLVQAPAPSAQPGTTEYAAGQDAIDPEDRRKGRAG